MDSLFDEIDRVAQSAIRDVIGESIALIGMISSDYARGADTARLRQDLIAVPALVPMTGAVSDDLDGSSKTSARRFYENAEIWIAAEEIDALDWQPIAGDRAIIAPDTPSERVFRVMLVAYLEGGDAQVTITEEKQP